MALQRTLAFTTVTPIFTGGIDEKMSRLQETGMLGNLRWWYEVLIRGVGGNVAAPNSDERCNVSEVFGATGWRRRFRLTIADENMSQSSNLPQRVLLASRSYVRSGQEKTPRWFYPRTPVEGHFYIQLDSLDPSFSVDPIAGLIQFVAGAAALGSRNQLGLGVVRPDSKQESYIEALLEMVNSTKGERNYPGLPSIKNMFFAQLQLNSTQPQRMFELKYDLRRRFATNRNDRDLRHFILGTVKGDERALGQKRMASKVKTSLPDEQGLMRVWGWVPEDAKVYNQHNGHWDRESALETIRAFFHGENTNDDAWEWRAFESPHNTNPQEHTDIQSYIRDLLRTKGGSS